MELAEVWELAVTGHFTLFAQGFSPLGWMQTVEQMVRDATGVVGLAVIGVYSFLVAVALPLPGEVVLAAELEFPIPSWSEFALLVLVSSVFKAVGSVVAFWVGDRSAGPITRWFKKSGVDLVEYGERATVKAARKWGYVGLAMILSIPFFPDTVTIYAFSALEENYLRFAGATFVGSAVRLLLVATVLAPFFDMA
ncbi:VTT domain-containing protein [Halobium salinum]|uniref:VTT domain-containing protein n=1 Tax=Halobium salinum TaxID=1364940 RepID=A0ABD5PBC3_9EURY|nr:VTT domain-containing protein [Halobium salinum]